MHDPMTVAWEIRAPWFKRDKHFPKGRYHAALVTVWHVDPETDGSDDSCDWSGRKLTTEAKALAKEMAEWDDSFLTTSPAPLSCPTPTIRHSARLAPVTRWRLCWRFSRRRRGGWKGAV